MTPLVRKRLQEIGRNSSSCVVKISEEKKCSNRNYSACACHLSTDALNGDKKKHVAGGKKDNIKQRETEEREEEQKKKQKAVFLDAHFLPGSILQEFKFELPIKSVKTYTKHTHIHRHTHER